MKTIYIDANDKYITSKIYFGKAADHKIYVDEALTTQASIAEVKDAFLKGVLRLQVGDDIFTPVKVSGVKVLVADLVSSAATMTEFTAKALED